MNADARRAHFTPWEIDNCARKHGVGTLKAEYILKVEAAEGVLDER